MHFNAAMLEVHSRLHAQWSQQRAAAESEQSQGGTAGSGGGGGSAAASWLKTVKAAVMAARRRRRHGPSKHEMAKEGAAPVSGIGNARALKQVAAALVGGGGAAGDGDVDGGGAGPALLCFDEFQVTDAFTAVSWRPFQV